VQPLELTDVMLLNLEANLVLLGKVLFQNRYQQVNHPEIGLLAFQNVFQPEFLRVNKTPLQLPALHFALEPLKIGEELNFLVKGLNLLLDEFDKLGISPLLVLQGLDELEGFELLHLFAHLLAFQQVLDLHERYPDDLLGPGFLQNLVQGLNHGGLDRVLEHILVERLEPEAEGLFVQKRNVVLKVQVAHNVALFQFPDFLPELVKLQQVLGDIELSVLTSFVIHDFLNMRRGEFLPEPGHHTRKKVLGGVRNRVVLGPQLAR